MPSRPEKHQEILPKAGARQNAYTTDDYTNSHITFAKEDLETMGEYNKNALIPSTNYWKLRRSAPWSRHRYNSGESRAQLFRASLRSVKVKVLASAFQGPTDRHHGRHRKGVEMKGGD